MTLPPEPSPQPPPLLQPHQPPPEAAQIAGAAAEQPQQVAQVEACKISFCITCMNRTAQLIETLPANLFCTKNLNVEFALLNYNSQDNLHEWVIKNWMPQIENGRIRYGHQKSASYFHMSKAKNLAHKLATGQILINLDADNFLGTNIRQVIEKLKANPTAIYHGWTGKFGDGTHGRIGMYREIFEILGGYDETLLPYSYEDSDMLFRAARLGIATFPFPTSRPGAILNTRDQTAMYAGLNMLPTDVEKFNKNKSTQNIEAGKLVANFGLWGQEDMEINFGLETPTTSEIMEI
jgi:hypothetical protein